jgi:hypothetical protein
VKGIERGKAAGKSIDAEKAVRLISRMQCDFPGCQSPAEFEVLYDSKGTRERLCRGT